MARDNNVMIDSSVFSNPVHREYIRASEMRVSEEMWSGIAETLLTYVPLASSSGIINCALREDAFSRMPLA